MFVFSWYHNGKSVLKGERKSILVKDGGFHYTPDSPDSGEDFDLGRFINNSKDKMDIANSRKQGITVGELIEKNKFLKPIEEALSDISDYTISPMPDNVKNPRRRASHLSKSKMIWLNMDVLRNDPRGFVVSFMHEVQHAKQMKKYKELSSKGKLTPEEKRFVDNYKELKKVNKIRLEYYNKHKKFLDDALKRLDELCDIAHARTRHLRRRNPVSGDILCSRNIFCIGCNCAGLGFVDYFIVHCNLQVSLRPGGALW